MDKSSLLRNYKKFSKQKHSKYTEEQLKSTIESLSPENKQIVFDLICISPLFTLDLIQKEDNGFSIEWNNIPNEIKDVIQVYIEKIQ